jgi:hypothetical protein
MSNIEKYLNKIVDYMVKHSKGNNFPFDSSVISFSDYCKNEFGLTNDEIKYVYMKYRYLMGWDQYDRSLPCLKKILKHY